MDKDVVKNLIKSNLKKFKKNELIPILENCKRIRNHVAHNFFVLNKILKINNRSNTIDKVLKEIKKERYSNKKYLNVLILEINKISKK